MTSNVEIPGDRHSIVIVENDKGFSGTLRERISEVIPNCDIHELDIKSSPSQVRKLVPAVVVLDWFGDTIFQDPVGRLHWKGIWEEWFTPVVVVSAGDVDAIRGENPEHPLVRYVHKGNTAMDEVVTFISELLPFGGILAETRKALETTAQRAANTALTRTLPIVWNEKQRDALLKRAAQRQLAGLIYDETTESDMPLLPWETYVVPPTAPHLAMGDILRKKGEDPNMPESYRVVLTPTCDIVQNSVAYVLVARCKAYREFCEKNSISDAKSIENRKKRLQRLLTEPESSGYHPLPGFPDKFPPLAVSLRELDLLPLEKIAVTENPSVESEYERVASIDSPFREWAAWAHLRIACRPGVPVRDTDTWASGALGG